MRALTKKFGSSAPTEQIVANLTQRMRQRIAAFGRGSQAAPDPGPGNERGEGRTIQFFSGADRRSEEGTSAPPGLNRAKPTNDRALPADHPSH